MAKVKLEHIHFAALMELQVRKRAVGMTPEAARAQAVANFEEVVTGRAVRIVERMAKLEWLKGVGSQMLAEKGDAEAAIAVKLYAWTWNAMKRVRAAIEAGELPDDVKEFLKAAGEEF